MRLFERLIISAGIGCFLTFCFFRGWRRRAGNHPLQNVLEFSTLQSQIFGLRHKKMIAQSANLRESKRSFLRFPNHAIWSFRKKALINFLVYEKIKFFWLQKVPVAFGIKSYVNLPKSTRNCPINIRCICGINNCSFKTVCIFNSKLQMIIISRFWVKKQRQITSFVRDSDSACDSIIYKFYSKYRIANRS